MCKLADNRKVCVGIVSYNRKDLLISLLNDLSNQSFPIYEIIIVDNCSSDGTPDSLIINEIIDDYVPGQLSDSVWRDIIIHYYRNAENVGGSGGFAKVFELFLSGDSDCIWAMDDDVSPERDCLSEMMKYLDADAKVCVACRGDDNYTDYAITGYDLSTLRLFHYQDCKRGRINSNELTDPYVEVKDMTFEGPLFARKIVEEIGLPDAEYFILFDDTDYACRASEYTKIRYIRNAKLHKMIIPTKIKNDKWGWKAYYKMRNSVYLERKLGKNIRVRYVRPLLRMGDLWLRAILRKRFSRAQWIVKAYRDGIKGNMGRTYAPEDIVIE